MIDTSSRLYFFLRIGRYSKENFGVILSSSAPFPPFFFFFPGRHFDWPFLSLSNWRAFFPAFPGGGDRYHMHPARLRIIMLSPPSSIHFFFSRWIRLFSFLPHGCVLCFFSLEQWIREKVRRDPLPFFSFLLRPSLPFEAWVPLSKVYSPPRAVVGFSPML